MSEVLDQIHRQIMKAGKNSCPVLGCGGNIIDIPDYLVETISNFNRKGYITKFVYSPKLDYTDKFEMYIIFDKILKEDIKKSIYNKWKLPEGLEMKFSVLRMTNNREEDDKYVSPRLTTGEIELKGKVLNNEKKI